MSDYPDPDEEYELMYQDELDILREQEELNNRQGADNLARRSLDFSSPAIRKSLGLKPNSETQTKAFTSDGKENNKANSQTDHDSFNISGIEDIPNSQTETNSKKRDIEDLFGDIQDLEFDDESSVQINKKRKYETEEEANAALIERIIQERNRKTQINNPIRFLGTNYTAACSSAVIENISTNIPKWPYVCATKSDGKKLFIRFHNEEYMERELNEITNSHEGFKSMLKDSYKEDWEKAMAYLEEKAKAPEKKSNVGDDQMEVDLEILEENSEKNQMWVERYKPMRYLELLSDESTNRTLLQWLKMWDKVVFNKEVKVKKPDINSKFNKRSGKFEFGLNKKFHPKNMPNDLFTELDDDNRPKLKIALLCGPPGCGKTTLAHLLAKHAGYNPVEVNASNDRNIESFKLALENATQMKSLLDTEKRPNCLILDEIDGAPLPTIEFLVKFISGATGEKPKKGQKARTHVLKRPVICICNDIYTSSLRPLKQIAFVVHFPPTQITRLSQRLSEVALLEGLWVDSSALTALGEKTNNDIRSCLGILHFLKSRGKQIKLSDVNTYSIGQKDMTKGLFQVWQEVFQIQLPKHQRMEKSPIKKEPSQFGNDVQDSEISLKSRRQKILGTVESYSDYERLMQGVYENYLDMKVRDSMLLGICQGLDWFIMNDLFNTYINTNQNYSLMPYLSHAFVTWHFLFAGLSWPKIKFPTQSFEVYQRQHQLSEVVSGVEKGMSPHTKPFMQRNALILDTLPIISHIISPTLRPVNVQLYSDKEKKELSTVVGVMLDYGLQYMQERLEDGTYTYNLDPNIIKVSVFDEKSNTIRTLSYALKQLISREVDLEKIKRIELKVNSNGKVQTKSKPTSTTAANPYIPNHLQKLQPKKIKETITKDFFGRTISLTPRSAAKAGSKTDDIVKSPIWYHYKEGFNNAVRRDVKIKDLL